MLDICLLFSYSLSYSNTNRNFVLKEEESEIAAGSSITTPTTPHHHDLYVHHVKSFSFFLPTTKYLQENIFFFLSERFDIFCLYTIIKSPKLYNNQKKYDQTSSQTCCCCVFLKKKEKIFPS